MRDNRESFVLVVREGYTDTYVSIAKENGTWKTMHSSWHGLPAGCGAGNVLDFVVGVGGSKCTMGKKSVLFTAIYSELNAIFPKMSLNSLRIY